ncbi:MAG: aminoglycoside phosphotransferase family protein [Catenulispora sp.]|nr:aminoglycoside phosphotransferase family protein [Catenulispora sp.]
MLFSEVDRGALAPITPWENLAWRAETESWIRAALAEHGRTPAAEGWRARVRRWSVLYEVPTFSRESTAGAAEPVWFKANPEASRFEAAVSWYLGREHPEHVLTPLAVDTEHGWTLLPDGGPVVRAALAARGSTTVAGYVPVVQQYAEFQRAVSAERVVELGVPQIGVKTLPETLEQIEAAGRALPPEERHLLDARLPDFASWCHELAAAGMPDAVDHADLHDGQIFAPGHDGHHRFFDWGDAAVTHPFSSMLVTTRVVRRTGADAKDVARLHDAYLEAWTGEYDRPALREMLALACRIEAVARILVWNRLFPGNASGSSGWAGELTEARDF